MSKLEKGGTVYILFGSWDAEGRDAGTLGVFTSLEGAQEYACAYAAKLGIPCPDEWDHSEPVDNVLDCWAWLKGRVYFCVEDVFPGPASWA